MVFFHSVGVGDLLWVGVSKVAEGTSSQAHGVGDLLRILVFQSSAWGSLHCFGVGRLEPSLQGLGLPKVAQGHPSLLGEAEQPSIPPEMGFPKAGDSQHEGAEAFPLV